MSSNQQPPADKQWNTALYAGKANFVWKYGRGVVELLAPRPGERILDLGCGTGHLTNLIAQAGAEVIGLDKSESMIAQARSLFPHFRFELGDGADFHFDQSFDAVFSNAKIHWMLDQTAVARCIWQPLKPGGRFVAEFGGKGNVEAIRAALREAIEAAGERVGLKQMGGAVAYSEFPKNLSRARSPLAYLHDMSRVSLRGFAQLGVLITLIQSFPYCIPIKRFAKCVVKPI